MYRRNRLNLFLKVMLLSLTLINIATAQDFPNLGLNNDSNGKFSFIQMNEHYAMTAKHISTLKHHDYECSTGCDLVFFKHEDKNFKPYQWRRPVINESVTQVGITRDGTSIVKKGVVTDVYTKPSNDSQFYRMSTTSNTVKGMSGGPVYGQDGKLIGMTIGTPEDKNYSDKVKSVFNPYEIIEMEWNIFQKSKYEGL